MSKVTLYGIMLLCTLHTVVNGFEGKTMNVFGKLKSSFQWATQFLGLDRASNVANLVSSAFGKTHQKMGHTDEEKEASGNVFSGFLRIFGFDGQKVGAIAINAIIFVAELISSTLSLRKPSELTKARKISAGTPFDWLLNNNKVSQLTEYIKDNNLPNHVITHIKEHSLDEQTDCIQLLICKTAPFVWGMQKALEDLTVGNLTMHSRNVNTMYSFLPPIEDIAKNGDLCEKKHPYCFIHL